MPITTIISSIKTEKGQNITHSNSVVLLSLVIDRQNINHLHVTKEQIKRTILEDVHQENITACHKIRIASYYRLEQRKCLRACLVSILVFVFQCPGHISTDPSALLRNTDTTPITQKIINK